MPSTGVDDVDGYVVYKRLPGQNSWTVVGSLPASATDYLDTNVPVGQVFEYGVFKWRRFGAGDFQNWAYMAYVGLSNTADITGYITGNGYISSGVEVPLTESRGNVILVVDNTYASALDSKLAQLEMDLIGDGWSVIRHDVSRSDTPPNIKALIQAHYNTNPKSTWAALLFGHVPVPYSGFDAPDGHPPHWGAWPADVYYGDMIGVWTDSEDYRNQYYYQTYGGSSDPRQINVPGDGKFDQVGVPGVVAIEIGRVDLANMPAFAPKTELDLLRQYLNKDHNYRNAKLNVPLRGFVDKSAGTNSQPGANWDFFINAGWRTFPPLVGSSNVTAANDYFQALSTEGYLWSYACGPGWFQGAGGVGQTSDFATYDPQTVFTGLFGSYFGDWDVPDNFLRAPLATSTYGLTCAWMGLASWVLHHMGLGETIGYSTRLTQNNPTNPDSSQMPGTGYLPGYGPHVSIALMGDPTLRLYPIAPASHFKLFPNQVCGLATKDSPVCVTAPGVATLSWQPSPDSGVLGYNLYKTDPAYPSWTRVNQQLITGTSYIDTTNAGGNVDKTNWMLRAVKLQSTPSGTYYDASEGIFATTYPCGLPNSLWGCGPGPCQGCIPF